MSEILEFLNWKARITSGLQENDEELVEIFESLNALESVRDVVGEAKGEKRVISNNELDAYIWGNK